MITYNIIMFILYFIRSGTRNFHQQDDAAFLNPLKLQKPHSNAFLDLNGDYVTGE